MRESGDAGEWEISLKVNIDCCLPDIFINILADWLLAIVYKSTDKTDVWCNDFFHVMVKNKSTACSFLWSIII